MPTGTGFKFKHQYKQAYFEAGLAVWVMLVFFFFRMGVTFIGSKGEYMEIKTLGKSERQELLFLVSFMTSVVQVFRWCV